MVEVVAAEEAEIAADREAAEIVADQAAEVRTAAARTVAEAGAKPGVRFPMIEQRHPFGCRCCLCYPPRHAGHNPPLK